ncbi:MAG TPA: CapA family protein [Candidatus Limnocylindrales bacterium]|nr:CapA family protein [Candidatus Limnocylindrales bacterium]
MTRLPPSVSGRSPRGLRRAPALVAAGLVVAGLAGAVGIASGGFGLPFGPPLGSVPSSTTGAPEPTVGVGPTASPTRRPSPTPRPTPTPVPLVDVAIVPITHFRSPLDGTSLAEVRAIMRGTSERYEALELVEADSAAIIAALGGERPADPARLVLAPDAATLATDIAASRKRLGILRADEVGPSVRALAWEETAMFGVGRVATLADWPLVMRVPAPDASEPVAPVSYDPADAWTLVAGGDILLDRGVAKTVKIDGKGVDFPFDGGTAEITSRYCCSSFGWELPRTQRTGNEGAMRALLQGADIAIANFENPAPNAFRYHTSGTVFSADPALIDGLVNAGIDYVSLANNHIRDAGARGVIETIENLEARGLAHGGAGRNIAEARRPALLEAGGVTVAILGYDTIARGYAAGPDRAGSAPLTAAIVREDIALVREAGADVVIVFPHWGTEYDATPFGSQRTLAHAVVDAGADLVIGNHAHWAGAMEVYNGRPIWYALGNFVFDQTWSEPTMEGITLELTFVGSQLVQVTMRPHIILDKAQPNFLDPAGDGAVVLGQVFAASKGLLDW